MSATAVSDDRFARAALIKLEVDRLALEAGRPDIEHDRLVAIRQEMEILVESLREIRREQLLDEIDTPRPAPTNGTWRSLVRRWISRG